MPFTFGDYTLDERVLELRRSDEWVPIEPQVFDLLLHLLENRDRVVTKVELLDTVWGDRFVSESALTTCIKQARQAVGDDGRSQQVIKTAHGRGYRFVAEVSSSTASEVDVPVEHEPQDQSISTEPDPDASSRSRVRGPRRQPAPQGRETDVDAVRRRLQQRQLVTLVGMGGIGKTHLLHHLGHELRADYEDGSVLIELAPVRSGDAVGPALLEAIRGGDKTGPDPIEIFLHWLESRNVLLLIDNAEHVAPEVAAVCRRILDEASDVDVLVTSRTTLDISGESVHAVGPLDADAAVALFVERAYDGGADLDPGRPELVELCRKLDGVPLALEIMAARAPLLSLSDLTSDLERHLHSATHSAGDERHRTLQATLQWSFDGLGPTERQLLEDLTVFAGSFDLRAAEAVSGIDDVTEPLLNLCHRSLVLPGPSAESSRFRLLEPVRLFVAAANTTPDGARSRHADYYLKLAQTSDAQIASAEIDQGMATIWLEWPNIRAAFNTLASERNADSMTDLITAVANYGEARLLVEVHEWADRAFTITSELPITPDPVLVANVARFSIHTGQLDRIAELLSDIDPDHPSNHVRVGFIVRDWYGGRAQAVYDILDKAIGEVTGQGGYWEGTFTVMRAMSWPPTEPNPYHLADVLEAMAERGGMTGAMFAQVGRGLRLTWDGAPELGVLELDQAVATSESFGVTGFAQLVHLLRTRAHEKVGEPHQAAAVLAESIRRAVESGGWSMAADSLGSAATILTGAGRADVAAQILAARRAAGYRFSKPYDAALQARVDRELDEASRATHDERGRRLTMAAAVDLAVTSLGELTPD